MSNLTHPACSNFRFMTAETARAVFLAHVGRSVVDGPARGLRQYPVAPLRLLHVQPIPPVR